VAQNAPTYMTPYLPLEALTMVKAHQANSNMPAFTWAMNQDPVSCQNCGGNGEVYLRLAEKGPFSFVPATRKVITYFDGDGRFGKGWYIIKDTQAFPCPECQVIVKPPSPMKP